MIWLIFLAFAAPSLAQTSLTMSVFDQRNPPASDFYEDRGETLSVLRLRDRHAGTLGERLQWQSDFILRHEGFSQDDNFLRQFSHLADRERSSRLTRRLRRGKASTLEASFEELFASAQFDDLSVIFGRRAVNWSGRSLFSPNDWFARSPLHQSLGERKPGVDQIELNYAIDEKLSLQALSVFGFQDQNDDPTAAPKTRYEARLNSHLLQARILSGKNDLQIIAGQLKEARLLGFGFSRPFGESLHLRAEGHQKNHSDYQFQEASLSFENSWGKRFTSQLEHFWHGSGYTSVRDYERLKTDEHLPEGLLATRYLGLGFSFKWTPLLNQRLLYVKNLIDHSEFQSSSLDYSYAEGMNLQLAWFRGNGRAPFGQELRSEFGVYPEVWTLASQLYF